jgi:LPXTG-motif cell wall-anchored protein
VHRVVRGSVALLVGLAVVLAGSGALAQETTSTSTSTSSSSSTTAAPLPGWTMTVTPSTVDEHFEVVTLAGPGFPGQAGCRFGDLFALGDGQTFGTAKQLLSGYNFDPPWTETVTEFSDGTNFTEGVFSLHLVCRDDGSVLTGTFPTGVTLTVLESGAPPPDPVPTTAAPTTTLPDTVGTVQPTSARAGETTVTIRGRGFKPSAKLDITLKTTPVTALGTTNALPDGTYAATVLIPATAPAGQHKLLVTGPGPDDVIRSTSADLLVIAAAGTGTGTATRTGTRTAAATGSGGTASTLPATGPSDSTPYFVMAGLTAMTLGAFLVGMSHPAVPARGRHRRRRHGLHRR